jgi:hypothetical protein
VPIRKELRHLYKTPEYKAARAACRERAGDRCEECGGGNRHVGYRHEGRFVRLTLGNPFPPKELPEAKLVLIQCGCSHVDNNPANNADDNLRWLCRGCHLAADAHFHKRTRATRKDAARPLLNPEAWGAMFEKLAEGGTCAPRDKKENHSV